MAADQRRGLGRGLSALLGEAQGPGVAAGEVRELPIEAIQRNSAQPRVMFAEEEIAELAASIREKGVLQPILVRPLPGSVFQIVAGERRWRAAQRVGLSTMPVLVRELDDRETLEIALIENVQRADLNPLEEARAYRTLMDGGRTQEEVAEVVGKSRPHVANLIRLLTLPAAIQQLVNERQLSSGHARALVGVREPLALARRIIEQGLSVREAEDLARRQRSSTNPASRSPRGGAAKAADTLALERDLSDRLGLKVEVIDRNGAGEVRIAYGALEQLDDSAAA